MTSPPTQPQVEHAQCHGIVAFAFSCGSSEGGLEFTLLLWREHLRPRRASINGDFGNSRGQLRSASPSEMDETQEASHVTQSRLAHDRLNSSNMVTRETPDIGRLHLRPVGLIRAELPLHESFCVGRVKVERRLAHPSMHAEELEVIAEPGCPRTVNRFGVMAIEAKPMNYCGSVVPSRPRGEARQNLDQQTRNYPAAELTQWRVVRMLTQPASYANQVTLILPDGQSAIVAGAQVITEVATDDQLIFRQSSA